MERGGGIYEQKQAWVSKEICQMIAIKLPLQPSSRLSPSELKSPCSANRMHLRLGRRRRSRWAGGTDPGFFSVSGEKWREAVGQSQQGMRGEEGPCSRGTYEDWGSHCLPTGDEEELPRNSWFTHKRHQMGNTQICRRKGLTLCPFNLWLSNNSWGSFLTVVGAMGSYSVLNGLWPLQSRGDDSLGKVFATKVWRAVFGSPPSV